MYESIRKRALDIMYVSKNTGFTIEQVSLVKGHIFYNKHVLYDGSFGRFDASFEIAESWRRLSSKDVRSIKDHDVLMIWHELYEIELMLFKKLTQSEAHDEASIKYNYGAASNAYYKSLGCKL